MYCTNCGRLMDDDKAFCTKCGTQLHPQDQSGQDTRNQADQAPTAPARKMQRRTLIPLAVVLAFLVGLGASLTFGILGKTSEETAKPGEESNAMEEPEPTPAEPGSSVNALSWPELSEISAQIAAASDEAGALAIAKAHGLCTADGKLDGTQTKEVEVADGIVAEVQIVGFRHDDKADGSGKAGITFMFKDCIRAGMMNAQNTNKGGWEASEMCTFLNSEVLSSLPTELQTAIVEVNKKTNAIGLTEDVASVTAAAQRIWLPSTTEICGPIDWYTHQTTNDLLSSEGSLYRLYSDLGVDSHTSNDALVKHYLPNSHNQGWYQQGDPCSWWLRSANPRNEQGFRSINTNGDPGSDAQATSELGIAPGFCI